VPSVTPFLRRYFRCFGNSSAFPNAIQPRIAGLQPAIPPPFGSRDIGGAVNRDARSPTGAGTLRDFRSAYCLENRLRFSCGGKFALTVRADNMPPLSASSTLFPLKQLHLLCFGFVSISVCSLRCALRVGHAFPQINAADFNCFKSIASDFGEVNSISGILHSSMFCTSLNFVF